MSKQTKTLLTIVLASTLCACTESPDPIPTHTDQLDQILREQQFMNNQMEHQRRMQQYGK